MTAPEEPVLSPDPIGPVTPPVLHAPEGLAGVGAALIQLGEALRRIQPQLTPVIDNLQAEVTAAMPAPAVSLDLDDGFGNGWRRCGRDCDLQIIRPGKAQCPREECQ